MNQMSGYTHRDRKTGKERSREGRRVCVKMYGAPRFKPCKWEVRRHRGELLFCVSKCVGPYPPFENPVVLGPRGPGRTL